jgi:hypothetical protein
MNVFVLHDTPETAAQMLCDKHIVKMTLETAQMLSTALHRHGVTFAGQYRPTHRNHPCTLWAGETRSNFEWLVRHGLALGREYQIRFHNGALGRHHASRHVIYDAGQHAAAVPAGPRTPFAMAMPAHLRSADAVLSYRVYYASGKDFARWEKGRDQPTWWETLRREAAGR